ncbi:unnamed protein product [Malus baccata var. baccata]
MSMSAEPSSLDVFTESENDLSKFPEAEFVESHEIQARVDPKVVIRPMEGYSSSILEQKLQQVKRLLRKMISAKTAELKARWSDHENMQIVVYQPPKYPMNMTPSLQVAQVQDKPPKSPTTVIGEEVVSFELPTEFSEDLKTLIPEGSPHRFSFSERLDGWRITQRRRTKGGKDTFYRHEKSNSWLMRSIVEAVRFMMYEKFPKQGGASSDDEERRTSSAPRQRKASDADCYNNKISEENMQGFDGEPYTEERVREFFKKPVKVPHQNPSPPSIFSCSSSREGHANSPSGPSMFGGVEARATATAERLQDFTVDMSYPRLEDIRITPMRPLS